MLHRGKIVCASLLSIALAGSAKAQLVRSAAGLTPADIQASVDTFRADLGTLNPNQAGSFGSGRREINWDGVPDAFASPNSLPADFFNVNSPRGVLLGGAGVTSFQVSANAASGTPVEFGNINATFPTIFETFSPQRLFTPLGNNAFSIDFRVAGSNAPATVTGFGAVFSYVVIPNTTSIQYFDAHGQPLGTFFVPAVAGVGEAPGDDVDETLSFLGVSFSNAIIGSVVITNGNVPVDQVSQPGFLQDPVVNDDFIYGEPIAHAVAIPLPPAALMSLTALAPALAAAWRLRRERR